MSAIGDMEVTDDTEYNLSRNDLVSESDTHWEDVMSGEYKINLPMEPGVWLTPKSKYARAWRRHWHILLFICKSLTRSKIDYKVTYHFDDSCPYALILSGRM
jgi:hypothetical protein